MPRPLAGPINAGIPQRQPNVQHMAGSSTTPEQTQPDDELPIRIREAAKAKDKAMLKFHVCFTLSRLRFFLTLKPFPRKTSGSF